MAEILAIVRYELLMGWRRGSSKVIFFVPILMPIIGFVLFTNTTFREDQLVNTQLSTEMAARVGTSMALMDTLFLVPMVMFLVPVLVAESIPLDRQYRMYEMLRTLPVTAGSYLTGKVLAVLVEVIAALTVSGIISLGIQSIRKSTLEVAPLALFWLGGIIALGVFTAVAGVIVPAMQPTRRRAVLLGWLVALISIGVYILLPLHEILMTAMLNSVVLTAPFPVDVANLPSYPTLFSGSYLRNYQIIAAALAAGWAFMTWRLRYSEPAK